MPFSLVLLILVICIEYIAIQKEKQNEKRRCVTNDTQKLKANPDNL